MPLVPWKKGSFGKGFLPKSPAAERPVLHLWRTDDEGYPFHLHGLSSYGVETDDVSALFAVNRDGAVTFLGGGSGHCGAPRVGVAG